MRVWRASGVTAGLWLVLSCGGRAADSSGVAPVGSSGWGGAIATAGAGVIESGAPGGGSAAAGAPSVNAGAGGASVAGASAIGGASAEAGSSGASGEATVAPPKAGDGRIPDPSSSNQGDGWDTCSSYPSAQGGPADTCRSCPAPSFGDKYLLFDFEPAPAPPPGDDLLGQVSFYFKEPQAGAGLWFDVVWVSGPKVGTKLSLWQASSPCRNSSDARILPLEHLLGDVPGKWVTGCMPFADQGAVSGFNLRIDTSAVIGLDAVRFGPACPQ